MIAETFIGLWKARFIYFTVTWARGEKEAKTRTLDKIEDVGRNGFSRELRQVYNELPQKFRPLLGRETPAQEIYRIRINCAYQEMREEMSRREHYNPLDD